MKRIYLDNGSTSFPKAPNVGKAMCDYIENVGVNIARGNYESAYSVSELVLDTRERLCKLFNFDKPQNTVFTTNVTTSLNMLLKGFLKAGDHVIISTMEHNAVMRPLNQLLSEGVAFDRVPCSTKGEMNPHDIESLIRPNTRLVIITHASNVCGTVMPIKEIGHICKKKGVFFVIDAAQTAGCIPIDMKESKIDALAFTGHKGLLGPQGIGGFIITDEFANETNALISGGTGSRSHLESVPSFLPDKYEGGTLNIPGILGLREALMYIEEVGLKHIGRHKLDMTMQLIDGFRDLPGIKIIGKQEREERVAVVSVSFDSIDNAEAAWRLESEFGILTRCGLHCAPNAHKTLGTFPNGTVRFAPGIATTENDVNATIEAMRKIVLPY